MASEVDSVVATAVASADAEVSVVAATSVVVTTVAVALDTDAARAADLPLATERREEEPPVETEIDLYDDEQKPACQPAFMRVP